MHSFKDATGHTWDLNLNLAAAERIDACDFSLLTDEKISILNPDETLLQLLTVNTGVIFACIWCIIYPEAKKAELTQEDFKERISGPTILPAKKAFWGALGDFFPEQKTLLSRMTVMLDKASKTREEHLEKLLPELEKNVDELLDQNFQKVKESLSET